MIRALWNNPARIPVDIDPLPVLLPPGWMADGICAGIGGANWDALDVWEQVGTCGQCPMIADRRELGIDTLEALNAGATVVYGGLTPGQIVDAAKARRAGEMPSRRGRIRAEVKTAPSGAETPSQGLTRSTSISAKEGLMPQRTPTRPATP